MCGEGQKLSKKMRTYQFPNPNTKICASIGFPNKMTKSPFMHNAGFAYLNLNYIYHGWEIENIKDAIHAMRSFNFLGYSISMPFKEAVIKYLDHTDEAVQAIKACNTVFNDNGVLIGFNSDWIGALTTLKQRIDLHNKHVLILGAGGTARAITYGLKINNANITILNRNVERAKKIAEEFDTQYGDINDSGKFKDYDVLINATSVGTKSKEDCDCRLCHFLQLSTYPPKYESEDSNELFLENRIALDVVFQRNNTEFTQKAQEKNFNIIHGHEMLVEQGAFQFELFTGQKAPKDVMYSQLKKGLDN